METEAVYLQPEAYARETVGDWRAEAFALNHIIKVYVPSASDTLSIDAATHQQAVDETIRRLSEWFGGATATQARGGWVAESGEVVTEDVTIVYAFCDAQGLDAHEADVIGWVFTLKATLQQEAMSVETDGTLYLL